MYNLQSGKCSHIILICILYLITAKLNAQSLDVVDFVDHYHTRYLPNLSIDCAVFCYHTQQLKVLLIRYHGHENWSLPGDFIQRQVERIKNANIDSSY